MKNVLVIGMIVVAMGYMFSIMYDKYEKVIAEQNQNRVMPEKK